MDANTRSELFAEFARLRQRLVEVEEQLGLNAARELPAPTEAELAAYGLLATYSSDFLSVHDANGDYLFASPSCQTLFQWQPSELVGHNAYEFFHPDDLARIAADHAKHSEQVPGFVRYRLRCADGSYRWVQTRSRARGGPGGVQQIVCITSDVQDEVLSVARAEAAERGLAEARQAEVLGRLSQALSHEINNPLTILAMQLELFADAGQDVEAARLAVRRVQAVLAELALVSSPESEQPGGSLMLALERVRSVLGPLHSQLRIEAVDAQIALKRSQLYAVLYAALSAHFEGCTTDETVLVKSYPEADQVLLTISGGGQIVRRVRADLYSVLRRDQSLLEGDLPVRLAQRIAAEAGVGCQIELSGGVLRTELRFQGSSVTQP